MKFKVWVSSDSFILQGVHSVGKLQQHLYGKHNNKVDLTWGNRIPESSDFMLFCPSLGVPYLNPGQLDTGHLDTGQLGTGQLGTHESGKVGQLDTSI